MKCEYCGRDRPWPCRNTRDMTDYAVDDDQICYDVLNGKGGGESGMRYVDANREATRRRRNPASAQPPAGDAP